jgi:glycosyltransferase involved in cell wall biosynthesis
MRSSWDSVRAQSPALADQSRVRTPVVPAWFADPLPGCNASFATSPARPSALAKRNHEPSRGASHAEGKASRERHGDVTKWAAIADDLHSPPNLADEVSRGLKILTIAHNAVAASNRRRIEVLRELPGIELTLLTPPWWFEEGRRVDVPRSATWRVGRTVFSGNGTRHLYLTGLVAALRSVQPDVIDLYEEPFSLVALQTLVLRNLLASSAALVFYSAVNVHRQWRWPYRWIEQMVLKHADGAHVPNQDVAPILRAKGFANRPINVIPLGVDPEPFASATPMKLRDVPKPRVGFVGRLELVKGLDVLVDAFALVSSKTPASLVIAGDGSEHARLQARIGPLKHRVSIIPPIAYEDMPAFLKSLDIVVLPSVTILPLHREQFGRVLVEAMAAGVAVIGSSSGAIPEVIGDAGLVVPERDPAALAAAIDRLLANPAQRQELVDRGLQRVRTRFAWPVVAEQTIDLFRAALAHRRHAGASAQAVRA